MQEFLQGGEDPRNHQNGQDGALIAGLGDVKAEDVPVGHLTAFDRLGHAVAADQIGHDHRHGHAGAEELIAAKALRRGKADEDGQEGKRRRGKQVH